MDALLSLGLLWTVTVAWRYGVSILKCVIPLSCCQCYANDSLENFANSLPPCNPATQGWFYWSNDFGHYHLHICEPRHEVSFPIHSWWYFCHSSRHRTICKQHALLVNIIYYIWLPTLPHLSRGDWFQLKQLIRNISRVCKMYIPCSYLLSYTPLNASKLPLLLICISFIDFSISDFSIRLSDATSALTSKFGSPYKTAAKWSCTPFPLNHQHLVSSRPIFCPENTLCGTSTRTNIVMGEHPRSPIHGQLTPCILQPPMYLPWWTILKCGTTWCSGRRVRSSLSRSSRNSQR